MKPVVFLDRDGTINVDSGYVTAPERVELISGVADAIAEIKFAGFFVVVVSNQSAVGRGMAEVSDIELTNQEVARQLSEKNSRAVLDQVLYSTVAPENSDQTRKPGVGMLKELRPDLAYDPKKSWMVGDKIVDIQFGINAGLPVENCILVLTGEGRKHESALPVGARIAQDLRQASSYIIANQ